MAFSETGMLSYQGIVTDVTQARLEITVQGNRKPACGGCAQQSGCSSLSETPASTARYFLTRTSDHEHLQLGDQVTVLIPKKAFWSALFYVYFLPALLAIAAMAGIYHTAVFLPYLEIWMLLAGLLAAAMGVAVASFVNNQYQPKVIRQNAE